MSSNPSPASRSGMWIGIAAFAIVAGVVLWVVVNNIPNIRDGRGEKGNSAKQLGAESSTAQFTPDEALELRRKRNLLIARLENQDPASLIQALGILDELEKRLPNDRFVLNNRLVAELLVRGIDRESIQVPLPDLLSPASVTDRLDSLRKRDPKSSLPDKLEGLLAVAGRDYEAALAAWQRVAKGEPSNPIAWAAIQKQCENIGIGKSVAGPEGAPTPAAAIARDASAQLVALSPENLSAYRLYFESAFPRGAAAAEIPPTKPEDAKKVVSAARERFAPLAPLVKEQTRQDLDKLFAEALTALDSAKPESAGRFLILIANVVKANDWLRSDLRAFEPHPLTYLQLDFETDLGPQPTLVSNPENAAPNAVKLQLLPDGGQLPPVPSGVAARVADFRLSGGADIVVATNEFVRVFGRNDANSPWTTICETPVECVAYGVLAADLDREQQVVDKTKAGANPAAQKEPVSSIESKPNAACQDNDPDLVVYGREGVQVFRNNLDAATGQRSLQLIEQPEALTKSKDVIAATLVDFDQEGDLDLILSSLEGITLWANKGNGEFQLERPLAVAPPGRVVAFHTVDWDHDADLDVLVCGDDFAGILENLRHSTLKYTAFEGEFAQVKGPRSLSVVDVDHNTAWALLATSQSGGTLVRATAAPGRPTGLPPKSLPAATPAGFVIGDIDNDSEFDAIGWGPNGLDVLRGFGAGEFRLIDGFVEGNRPIVIAIDIADVDGDGDLDLVTVEPSAVRIWDNVGGNALPSSRIRLRAQATDVSGAVNTAGIGSIVELRSGDRYRRQIVTGQVTHFGCGSDKQIDSLRVIWTNGVPQDAITPELNTTVCEIQLQTTSCPSLYVWNGREFVFETDLLWGAPLGLQSAPGVITPTRNWENIFIPGDRMQPKDGEYVMQLTEELWEAGYFDRVQLICIDHPSDVQVFSNEKVGPPDLAAFGVHTVRQARRPVSARDSSGRDCLAAVLAADDRYAKCFPGHSRRGRVEQHYLELDFGDLGGAKQITLFLRGWLYPPRTSQNVGISQDATHGGPAMPSLWVPSADGDWVQVRPFMGFPGGKTKTIAVDVSDLINKPDSRLRIATNVEFYWDAAFLAVDEPAAETRLTRLDPIAADLHFRGWSTRIEQPDNAPDTFDYNRVETAAAWFPMDGPFTRYGDVLPLLKDADDLMAVMASGDELTVRFAAPAAPPAGWTRDFILHNVGYDKDSDLHVIYGQSAEPLPFAAMSGYPYRADEAYPDTEQTRTYRREYQTRHLNPSAFRRRQSQRTRQPQSSPTPNSSAPTYRPMTP